MKLTVNLIAPGKYYRAFEDDVPDDRVPDHLRKFAVQETAPANNLAALPEARATSPPLYVKRGSAWKRRDDQATAAQPDEPTYVRVGKAFKQC